jgi:hypothetical protein
VEFVQLRWSIVECWIAAIIGKPEIALFRGFWGQHDAKTLLNEMSAPLC